MNKSCVAFWVSWLAVRSGISVRTALVYEGTLSPRLEAAADFDSFVEFGTLVK